MRFINITRGYIYFLVYVLIFSFLLIGCNFHSAIDKEKEDKIERKISIGDKLPNVTVISDYVKSYEREGKFIGNVLLKYDEDTNFNADQITIRYARDRGFISIKMEGNVLMKRGKSIISSQLAFSDNFREFIDFQCEVTVRSNGSASEYTNYRYNF